MNKIYHGSKNIIENPVFGHGSLKNDYGLGFYCTEDINLAKEWGVSRDQNGYANIYVIDETDLSVLNLNDSKFSVLHWLAVLLENRTFDITTPLAQEAKDYLLKTFSVSYKEFDVLIGYRADDSYFSFAQDFINGAISVRQLANSIKLGKLGTQYVLKTQKAFDALSFCGYEVANCSEWYEKKENRDRTARRQYFDQERNKRQPGDLFITQIIDQEIKANDTRIR